MWSAYSEVRQDLPWFRAKHWPNICATAQCANKTVREANPQANTQGTPVPFNRLRGVSKVAADVVCNVEASGKAASQRRNGN